MEKEEKKEALTFVTSFVTAFPFNGVIRHFQFSVFSEDSDPEKFRCYFDVVDPSQVKLQDA